MTQGIKDKKTGLTPKMEKFCQEYIRCDNMSEAYRLAYNADNMKYSTIHRNALELSRHSKVAARIASLQKAIAQKYEVSAESLAKELDEARDLAMEHKQSSSAVAATMGKARLYGLDKQVLSNDPENPLPSAISIEIVRSNEKIISEG